ncbi:hypothetical protein BSKO_09953 [Bryopsis sp. KO-2023]|nr:hypothetical protein BSKO_09953 [Bryopsis sp. KO-2023]
MANVNPYAAPPLNLAGENRTQATWSPYDNNGGTCLAVAGADYCIIASTTRLSTGFSVLSRDHSSLIRINDKCVIISSGFQADIRTLQKEMQARHVMYQHQHSKPMSCSAMAQLLANTMYYRRFFPYYTFSLCAGIDEKGVGAVYNYDAVGSCQRVGYSCSGSGESLIQPVMDNQLKAANPLVLPARDWLTKLPVDQALDLVKDAFSAAGERDIFTGDAVEILIVTKDGITEDRVELKKD